VTNNAAFIDNGYLQKTNFIKAKTVQYHYNRKPLQIISSATENIYLAQNLVNDHKEYNKPTPNKTQYDTNWIIKRTQHEEV